MTSKEFRRAHNKGFLVYAVGAALYTAWFIVALPLLSWWTGIGNLVEVEVGVGMTIAGRIFLTPDQAAWYWIGVVFGMALPALSFRVMDKGFQLMLAIETAAKTRPR